VHIPHDAIIEDYAVITPMVSMGGIVRIMYGANLALGCTVHQYSVIGSYSITAMGSTIIKNIKPFSRYIPGKDISVNMYAIEKFGLTEYGDEISNYVLNDLHPTSDTIVEIVQSFEKYSQESSRGVYGR
jgi:UDP-N-acetylglucosamine acyltransferase